MGRARVALIGSGNWGSAVARIIGRNVKVHSKHFETEVRMYTYEEEIEVNGRKVMLHDVINEKHENVKYLPGVKLPSNVVAIPNVADVARDADLLVFVLPHQFVPRVCKQMAGQFNAKTARAISLIKGTIWHEERGELQLVSHFISEHLSGVPTSVLMGANVANEVAQDVFCESTVGAVSERDGQVWRRLFHEPKFQVSCVTDVAGVELCGALKNVVAIAAGFVDGMDMGFNTKAAVMRIGMLEMRKFAAEFYGAKQVETYFESCGMADLITTCMGGRNVRVAREFVKTGRPFDELESEMLRGQKLQGTLTAREVQMMLRHRKLEKQYPLFTTVYRIAFDKLPVQDLFLELGQHRDWPVKGSL